MERVGTAATRIGVAAAAAAGGLALNRYLVDRETRPGQAEPGGRLVRVAAGAIHVVEDGHHAGPPIVLLHGFAGSLHWFDRLAPLLAPERHVIRVDLLGHGGSEKPASGYEIPEQAALVAGGLDLLEVQPEGRRRMTGAEFLRGLR